jgi:glycosyltransferase involved in cell wall biosynthesis
MASSCPVLASDIASIPEIACNAALYFDPTKPEQIAEAMIKLIDNPAERETLIKNGRRRVKDFSSDKMARETLNIYENLGKKS